MNTKWIISLGVSIRNRTYSVERTEIKAIAIQLLKNTAVILNTAGYRILYNCMHVCKISLYVTGIYYLSSSIIKVAVKPKPIPADFG